VLSRIAESLFWVGRYLERAEDTARFLEVHLAGALGNPEMDEEAASRQLLTVMGIVVPPPDEYTVDAAHVSERLAFDASSPTSIPGAIGAARENARGARESLSSEVWEAINGTWNALPGQRLAASQLGPFGQLRFVRDRTAAIAGMSDSTLVRDDGWRFLMLGKYLERADMTARLLTAAADDPPESATWAELLRSCGAHEAFLRTYRRAVDGPGVIEFLLLDRLFPRSVWWSLAQVGQSLSELDAPGSGRIGPEDPARRLAGRARVELEYRTTDEIFADLPELLPRVQRACSAVSEAVTARWFRSESPVQWMMEESA
jgi:uncharacterized alpha-E superfamily protein